MYVTESQLRAEIRELHATIKALAKDHGAEFLQLYTELESYKEQFETQQDVMNQIIKSINIIEKKLDMEQE